MPILDCERIIEEAVGISLFASLTHLRTQDQGGPICRFLFANTLIVGPVCSKPVGISYLQVLHVKALDQRIPFASSDLQAHRQCNRFQDLLAAFVCKTCIFRNPKVFYSQLEISMDTNT